MILLAFLSCLVFFFVKDQIVSFQLKQIIVFLSVLGVCLFHCVIATEFDY